MHFRDLSIRKRLLLSNYIMIFIPVAFMFVLSVALFLSLRFGNVNRASMVSFVWPESGPTLATQFELTRLRVRSDSWEPKNKKRERSVLEAADHLGDLGYQVVILKPDGSVYYQTHLTDGRKTMKAAMEGAPEGRGSIAWSDHGLAFHYYSDESGLRVGVIGKVPMVHDGEYIDVSSKEFLKKAFTVICIIVVILTIVVGIYLARWISRQIIGPLEDLQDTANNIAQGNLDKPVPIYSEDEIGKTMQAFETTRQQLKIARETRERYDQSRKELIAGISHDLRTPLTKIEGYAYGLKDGIANTPDKKQHYVKMIIDTAENMGRLVQELFLFSKLDLGQVEYNWEKVDLIAYLRDFTEDQKDHFEQQGLQIDFSSAIERAVIKMDRLQMSRIVGNILGNSLKYKTEAMGHASIIVQQERPGFIQMSFTDDGPGVPEGDRTKIFESFYRTDKARTNPAKGSGLGLAVVKQLVDGMDGSIWADNVQPHGLKITIEVPCEEER
ncbi:MAG: HAMP domain-containing histidine kinase [Acidaminococcus sp.]|jgi:signal transduction histidine kinase|nr:HAMP domain-containing histidine kinase [Acidaminococcus sp.]MCI2114221.1 HAMP domain-containing histidine kinase [Acidaminococcus sp.]MCI2116156.1 HAMP domain-containing histidine kinase [Acidaminococcus sp.]